ncbi:NAC domain-containing protein 62-like [Iris pallida]|uniref:NAC domain-containing protein 62-like n=1 Tax=Iris pallida TaxID=29817 RepID=A0AAX6DZT1_IRIPA|nr:NAC domain-containing protein 62-like [Iris pallida]
MTVVPLEALPLGFRFHPTDEELVNHYLKRKINGRIRSELEVIPEIDVCKCEPWDLPDKSLIRSCDPEWFFFSPKDRKYPKGHRSNRATEAGYWKATGKDRTIRSKASAGSGVIGMKKTLVFHQGRAPKGVRTHWIMHEYRTTEPEFESGEQGGYVLYRLFRKAEEKSPSPNSDEIERSGLSPTPTKSSPDGTQNEGDGLEDIDIPTVLTPISQISPVSDMQEQQSLSTTIEKQPSGITRWLADKADRSTLKPENSGGRHVALDVKGDNDAKGETLVDPLLEALERFCDPQDDPIDAAEFPNISSPMLPYSDHPFFGNTDQESHMRFGQPDYVEQDSMNDFLNSILSNQENYSEASNFQQTSTTEAMHSRSSSELDAEEGLMQGALGFGNPGWCYADTSTFGFPEFNDSGLYQNSSLLPCDSTGPDVYSVDSGADSVQGLLNSVDESTGNKNIFGNGIGLNGTGVELRTRSNRLPSVGHLSATQGSAKRRIIFMSSVRPAATSSTVCESGSDKENYEDTEAAVEVGENEYSCTESGLDSDKEDLQSSTEARKFIFKENEELDDIAKERCLSECLGSWKQEDAAICGNISASAETEEVSCSAISQESEPLTLGDTDEGSRSKVSHESKPLALTETGRAYHSETPHESRPIALADTKEASPAGISDDSEPKLRLRTKPKNEIIESGGLEVPALILERQSSNKSMGNNINMTVFLLVILLVICVGVWSWGRSQSVSFAGGSI